MMMPSSLVLSHKHGARRLVALLLLALTISGFPVSVLAQQQKLVPLHQQFHIMRHKQRGIEILDTVYFSVKERVKRLEDEARKEDIFFYGNISTNPDIADDIEKQRQALLAHVKRWEQAGKEEILAIKTDKLNRFMNEATAVGYYYGLDVVKLTKLYELGKDVIRNSMFELPGDTHPDRDRSYKRIRELGLRGVKEPFVPTMQLFFDDVFSQVQLREIEIAEYLAKKREYKVLLFKRITLVYLRALLSSGETLPVCNIKGKKLEFQLIDGKQFPVYNCPDPSLEYLRQYVNAIRDLQSAESDTFMAYATTVMAEQQLAINAASVIPLVGDAIDWYALAYGLYAKEDFTGRCLTHLDYAINFVAAALPLVGPRILNYTAARSPRVARMIVGITELAEWINDPKTWRRLGVKARIVPATYLNELGAIFGMKGTQFGEVAKRLRRWLNAVETREKQLAERAIRQAKEHAEKTAQQRAAKIMAETLDDADSQIRALKQLEEEAEELVRMALRESDETLNKNLLDYVANRPGMRSRAIQESNIVPSHAEAIMDFLERVKRGEYGTHVSAEELVIIMRDVNPDATRLIEMGFFTKGMAIKGKSADWGVHRGFVPLDQHFSKLNNPNLKTGGKLTPDKLDKIAEFDGKVKNFFKKLKGDGIDPGKYKTALKIKNSAGVELPVVIVTDKKTRQSLTALFDENTQTYFNVVDGAEVRLNTDDILPAVDYKNANGETLTAFMDSKTGTYTDEFGNVIDASNVSNPAPKPLEVMAVPDENGIPRAVTADYDFLAFGFSDSGITTPKYNDVTGYISDVQEDVLDGMNKYIQRQTGYKGKVSHHGPEVQFPFSPGALEADPRVTAFDPVLGRPVIIPRCDVDCMLKWCRTTGNCQKFGFLTVGICNPKAPVPPCIPVDPNRLLKDYMHSRRLQGFHLFPNAAWKWGDYNLLGGWTMVNFMRSPFLEQIHRSTMAVGKATYDSFLKGVDTVLSCPYGKRASDHIREAE